MGKGKQNNSTNTAKNYNVGTMQYAIATVNDCFGYIKDKVEQKYDGNQDNIKKYTECGKVWLKDVTKDATKDALNLIDDSSRDLSDAFGVHKSPSKNEPAKYKDYGRASKIWKEGLVEVTVNVAVQKESTETSFFDFYAKLDIDEDKIRNNTEQKDRLSSEFSGLEQLIKKQRANITILNQVDMVETSIDSNFKVPIVKVKLYDENKDPRTDYQNVVNELAHAIVLIKAFYKYVIENGDKDTVWQKVLTLAKALQVAEEKELSLGKTVLNISDKIFDGCKQMVLTGAPGTGKTYSAKEYVKWQLMSRYNDTSMTFEEAWKNKESAQGKELAKYWRMVQFHPSFDYTDFVEGLRPITLKDKDGKEQTTFVRMDGVFKEFCRTVVEENKKSGGAKENYYFIIDEINRADLSKVFGELMYCLEEGYRGEENAIRTQYANLDTYSRSGSKIEEEDVFKNGFYIPENVIIIGTMNDIDRSVDTFDFALRRRFRWVSVDVDETLLKSTFHSMAKNNESVIDNIDNYVECICAMNQVFKQPDYTTIFKTPEAFFIGPAYFEGLFKGISMNDIWINKVEPLLKEYIRGRDTKTAERFVEDCHNALITGMKDTIISEIEGTLKGKIIEYLENNHKQKIMVGNRTTVKDKIRKMKDEELIPDKIKEEIIKEDALESDEAKNIISGLCDIIDKFAKENKTEQDSDLL